MNLKNQSRHKKLLAWMCLVKAARVMRRAEQDPHFWIEEQNRRIPEFVQYIYNIPFYRHRFDMGETVRKLA